MAEQEAIRHFVNEALNRTGVIRYLREQGVVFRAGSVDYTEEIVTDEIIERILREDNLRSGLLWCISRVHDLVGNVVKDAVANSHNL